MSANLERFAGMDNSKRYLVMSDGEQALLIDLLEAGGHPVFTDDTQSADTLRELGVCEGEPGGRNYTLRPSALTYGEVMRHELRVKRQRARIPGVNEYLNEL